MLSFRCWAQCNAADTNFRRPVGSDSWRLNCSPDGNVMCYNINILLILLLYIKYYWANSVGLGSFLVFVCYFGVFCAKHAEWIWRMELWEREGIIPWRGGGGGRGDNPRRVAGSFYPLKWISRENKTAGNAAGLGKCTFVVHNSFFSS